MGKASRVKVVERELQSLKIVYNDLKLHFTNSQMRNDALNKEVEVLRELRDWFHEAYPDAVAEFHAIQKIRG